MERLLKITSLILVSLCISTIEVSAVNFNTFFTSQTITLTESNSDVNVLDDNAIIDVSKEYDLTLDVDIDVNNIIEYVSYTLALPSVIKVGTKTGQYIEEDENTTIISIESGMYIINFFSLPQTNTAQIKISGLHIEPADNYDGELVSLKFPYGNTSTDINVTFTNYTKRINGLKVTNTEAVFDGNSHKLAIETNGNSANSTLNYSTDGVDFGAQEPAFVEAGDYTVYVKASLEGYNDTVQTGHIIITPKPVTIKADDLTIHEGEENSTIFSYYIEGVLTGYPIQDIVFDLIPSTENQGTIRCSLETNNKNYDITFVNGTYTITPHIYQKIDTIVINEATCTVKGSQKIVSECTICQKRDTAAATDIEALGHIQKTTVLSEASCNQIGKTVTTCERCNDTIEVIIAPKTAHTWGKDSTYTKNPTCVEKGAFTTKCFVCDSIKEDSIDALGHDFDIIKVVDEESTCAKEGSKSRHCKRIGCDAKTDVEVIAKKEHTWGRDTTIVSPATCVAKGEKSITCLKCDATKTDSIDALGHQYAETFSIDIAPKCTEDGIKSKHCIRCDASIEPTKIQAIGHEFDTVYTIDKEPNCMEYGSKSRHCIHEGCLVSIDTIDIEALGGHMWETYATIKEATCLEGGIVDRKCTKCGEIQKNFNVKALGHTYTDTFVVDIEPTCILEGTQSKHCIRCSEKTEISSIPATGHIWDNGDTIKAPTCLESGLVKFNCIKGDSTKTDTIKALGHDFETEFTVDNPATCTTDGQKSHHCKHSGCEVKEGVTVITSPGHQWKDTLVSKAPTCLEEGEYTITCIVCQATKKEAIQALGHNFSLEFTIDIKPTCEGEGKKSRHCLNNNCEAVTEETVIDPTGHSMVLDTIQIKATCEQDGQSIYKCEVCNKKETRVEAALGHVFADTFTVDRIATCKTEGIKSKHCIHEGCLEKIEIFAIPQGDHILKENQIIQKATCTENGLTKFKCEVCGTMVDSTIQKLGHDWENQYTIDLAPTCTRGGSKSKHCTRCDAKTGTTVIPSPGHMESQVRWENVIEPTCTENGEHDENFYCDRCGDLLRTSHKIDLAKGHDYEGTEEYFVKPTCTESGVVLYTCKVCGNIAKDSVKAMGHLFADEYTVDKPATCLELGSESRHCTRTDCDAKYDKRDIAPIGHLWNESDTIQNPSCTEKGIISKFCERCQAKEEKILDPLGHAYADTFTVDVPPTCMQGGSKSRHCIRCEQKKDITTLNPIDHQPSNPIKEDYKPASCLEPGTYTEVIVCRFCGLELSRTQGVSEPPTGHIWDEGVDVVAPTCLEGGVKTFTCTVCNAVDTRNVEALGHTYADTFTIDKPVTCLTDGLQSRHCIRCDIHGYETVITATGHVPSAEIKENEVIATCTTAGQYDNVVYCAACKKELSRSHVDIDPLGHNWNMGINIQEPTCTGKGVISHTCKVCNITETMEISELGHDFKDTVTVDATCIDKGYIAKRCSRCNTTSMIEEIPVKGHQEAEPVQENIVPATCKSMGAYDEVIYCSVCNKEIHRTQKDIGYTDHTWDEGNITQEPTCTQIGNLNYTCTVCGEKRTEILEALGHDYEDTLTVDVNVTCENIGVSSRHCSRCDSKIDFDTIPAIGHLYDNGVITKEATGDEEGVKTFTCVHCGLTYTNVLMKLITLNEIAQGQFFSVNAEGYCQGDEGYIGYSIRDGVPVDYKLTFSDSAKAQGFSDIDWTTAPIDQQIQVNIPENCVAGKYSADIVFRNEDTVETQPLKVFITVNLGQEFMIAIFRDVVSIVNDGSKVFESYQWYHNNELVEGATLPYYQETGGLSGTYYVRVNLGSSNEERTCARNNWYNPLNKNRDFTVFPNPIQDGKDINIKMYNFEEGEHMLNLINEFGTVIYGPFMFSSDELTIPSETINMVSGQYVISIDGVNVKVLKQ